MPKILIGTSSFDADLLEIKALEVAGYEIVLNPYKRRLSEGEIKDLLTPDIVGLIAGLEPLTKDVLAAAENLRVISRCGTGMDTVDMGGAMARNIKIFNTPDAPTPAVAELTVGLMLSVLRNIPLQDRAIRKGAWERPMGSLLGSKTVGLIGLGRIGSAVANILAGFGAKVIGYDAYLKAHDRVEILPLEEVLAQSDILSLHIPCTEKTENLINLEHLARMKHGAVLINTARGELVDEAAVVAALESDQLGAAAFDVYGKEPYDGPLVGFDNVVLTAHVGSYAAEARARQEAEAAKNMLAGLETEEEGLKTYG